MQASQSLTDFLSSLDAGPRGVTDALDAIKKCAEEKSDELDLQQMSLTDEDLETILPDLHVVAVHVKILNLFMNELTELPAGLGVLSDLRELRAGANPLSSISEDLLRALPSLEELDVGYSELLEELPDAFDGTPALRVLLIGNNRLRSLPRSVYSCTQLEELHAYGNCITHISSNIAKLQLLRVLNIGRNQVSELPAQIAECRSLSTLHVYENCLSSLPSGIDSLPALAELTVLANSGMPNIPSSVRAAASAKATASFLANVR